MKYQKTFYGDMNMDKAMKIRRQYFVDKKKQREIAEIHNIGQGTVSRIISNIVWVQ